MVIRGTSEADTRSEGRVMEYELRLYRTREVDYIWNIPSCAINRLIKIGAIHPTQNGRGKERTYTFVEVLRAKIACELEEFGIASKWVARYVRNMPLSTNLSKCPKFIVFSPWFPREFHLTNSLTEELPVEHQDDVGGFAVVRLSPVINQINYLLGEAKRKHWLDQRPSP